MIIPKTEEEIEIMREAGRIAAQCLQMLAGVIKPGVTTGELDSLAERFIRERGALPTFKGYLGFPGSICTSVNNVVVHGIPGDRKLREGDIISIDVGATYKGYVGDTAATFPVGQVSPVAEKLIRVTRESLMRAVQCVRPGATVGDIGFAVESYVRTFGFSVVRDYVGHGVGRSMHEDPPVPNFGRPGEGPVLKEGYVIAIEPMVNEGTGDVITFPDLTVVTKDGKLSAHFEHTVAVTKEGARILTLV
ncbi:MAG: type I methionyl aminopeptidase [Firmicutes bacterium]|nr:type I methionyl aminopeptidase [Candidatus Fermentithermobacillaceae bacterium]